MAHVGILIFVAKEHNKLEILFVTSLLTEMKLVGVQVF